MLGYGFDYDSEIDSNDQLKQNYHMYLYRKEDLGNQIAQVSRAKIF